MARQPSQECGRKEYKGRDPDVSVKTFEETPGSDPPRRSWSTGTEKGSGSVLLKKGLRLFLHESDTH